MLQQAEGALRVQRDPEDRVPAGQHIERPWAVQVQEVDVGHGALQDALWEGEHEALLHGPARGVQHAAHRQQRQEGDDADAPDRWPRPPLPYRRASEHEGVPVGERGLGFIGRKHGATAEAEQQWCDADRCQQAEHGLGRGAEPHGAIRSRGGESDGDQLRSQRQQRNSALAQDPDAVDAERDQRVVGEQAQPRAVLVAALDRCELGVLPRPEELPLATDASSDHLRQTSDVILGVVDADLAPGGGPLRFITGRLAVLLTNPLLAIEVPEADELAVVRLVAVGVDEHLVAVRRQRYELFVGEDVADHPRRQHQQAAAARDGELSPALPRHQALLAQHQRQHEQRHQEDALAARQGGEADEHAEAGRELPTRSIVPAIGAQDREDDQRRHQPLREQHAVDQPQVGVERRDEAGDDRHRTASEYPPDEQNAEHHQRAEHRRHHPVVEVGGATEAREEAQYEWEQRTVEGALHLLAVGDPMQWLREASTGREHVRGGVVEERVTAVDSCRSDGEEGDDAPHEGQRDDATRGEREPVVRGTPRERQHDWLEDQRAGDDADRGGDDESPEERREAGPVEVHSQHGLGHSLDVLTGDDHECGLVEEQQTGEHRRDPTGGTGPGAWRRGEHGEGESTRDHRAEDGLHEQREA